MDWDIIGSGDGLSPDRRKAITWINDGLLSIGLLRTYFSEIWIWVHFIQENAIENVVCLNGGHFVQGGKS